MLSTTLPLQNYSLKMYVQSLKIKTSCCVGWLVGVSSTSCCCSWPCSALRAESENSGLWTGQEREKGSEQLHSIGAEKLESLSGLPQQNIITTYIKAICTLVYGYLQLFKPIDFYLLHLRLVWTEKKVLTSPGEQNIWKSHFPPEMFWFN